MNQEEIVRLLAVLQTKNANLENDIKILQGKYEDLLGKVSMSNTDIQRILLKIENMEQNTNKDLKEMKKILSDLTNKPAKNWDKIVSAIIGAIITGVIGFILFKLGLK